MKAHPIQQQVNYIEKPNPKSYPCHSVFDFLLNRFILIGLRNKTKKEKQKRIHIAATEREKRENHRC